MRLQGRQFEQFRDALLNAFPPRRFDDMLLFQLNIRRTDIAILEDQRAIVLEVIKTANFENWIPRLLQAARTSNPGDPGLFALAQQFGRAASTPPVLQDNVTLERTIRAANGMLDVVNWRTRLAALEHQICRVEIPGSPPDFGTGFLLGADVVMTNYHVIEKVHNGQIVPTQVTLRFDFALLADGVTPNPGTVYRLADQQPWLIDHSAYSPLDSQTETGGAEPPVNQLDYALLRVAGAPGQDPVGGPSNKDPGALPRQWIPLPAAAHDFAPDTALFIMQHPAGQPLKLALETKAVIGVNGNKTRVRYRTNTEPGSSGSPCFDANWNLVALHHAGDPNYQQLHHPEYNQGIPFRAILDLLATRQKIQELGQ